MLIAFNKPYGVLSQFTSDGTKPTLADYIDLPNVYAAGRLDFDSEGLLLLTDDGPLQHAITDPAKAMTKRYLAQVEGIPSDAELRTFEQGLTVGEGAQRYRAKPASAVTVAPPPVAERSPPIRVRAAIPTAWIAVEIDEGRNRQVRRMTAAIGYPTLRLIRVAIGRLDLFELGLAPGMWCRINPDRLAKSSGGMSFGKPASGQDPSGAMSTGFRNRRYWD